MADQVQYLAVIGDLIGSRDHVDRAGVQTRLEETLGHLNELFTLSDQIRSRFVITIGDEFQGLLSAKAPLDRVWWEFARLMQPDVPARFGFGLGAISTPLRDEALGMDGPCFWSAREAIEQAHAEERQFVFRAAGSARWSDFWNQASLLLDRSTERWTRVQWETAALLVSSGSQADVASQRGVSRQAVSASLTGSLGVECIESFRGLAALVWLLGQGESGEVVD